MVKQGENLIFLISQPRAGSTLLQRILGSHPEIYTASEVWLMLPLLYPLKFEEQQAGYNPRLGWRAVRKYIGSLPQAEEEYIEGIRRMCSYLYGRALETFGKRFFLDKTPRYYLIIPELYRTFPEAHYIIILRNPLAVLYSMFRTWAEGNWLALAGLRQDLLNAPKLIVEGTKALGERCIVVHYEHLVENPKDEVRRICEEIGIEFIPKMLKYDRRKWEFGDQCSIYEYEEPVLHERWREAIKEPQVWRLLNDYLNMLGKEMIGKMGYDYKELKQILENHKPTRIQLPFTLPLDWLLKKPLEERKRYEKDVARLLRSIRQRGLKGTVLALAQKLRSQIKCLLSPS